MAPATDPYRKLSQFRLRDLFLQGQDQQLLGRQFSTTLKGWSDNTGQNPSCYHNYQGDRRLTLVAYPVIPTAMAVVTDFGKERNRQEKVHTENFATKAVKDVLTTTARDYQREYF